MTEPVVKQPRNSGGIRGAAEWLDALSSGACDQAQFVRGVAELVRNAPDAGWELLGLADQYYRRGKISAQMFGTLKTHLQGLLVGGSTSDEVSAPMPQMQDEPPFPAPSARRAAPAAASPHAVSSAPAASSPKAARAAPAASSPARGGPAGVDGAAPRAAPAHGPEQRALAIGDVLRGRYIVQGLLGQGGMGAVYAAIDQFRLDRSPSDQKVAIKLLHTEVIKRPRLFAELRREFQHLQSLSHPNIVRVHEFDRDGDLAFFTMEYLSGALLSRVLSARASSVLHRPYALAIIRDVGAAVAHAHARGVVHGDLNPGNIFITDNGEVRVLDFGASHQLHRGPWISEFDNHQQIAVATPGFASCQVLEGEAADARDDVYALACVAYVLLTGDNPFQDSTALKARSLRLTPARPRGLDGRQWQALRAGLQFDRERRPSDMRAWLERLELRMAAPHLPALLSIWTARPRAKRRVRAGGSGGGAWVAAAVMVAGIAACGWWAAANMDTVAQTAARVGAAFKTQFARASEFAHDSAGPLWDKSLRLGRKPEPVIQAPTDLGDAADATGAPPAAESSSAQTATTQPTVAAAPAAAPHPAVAAPIQPAPHPVAAAPIQPAPRPVAAAPIQPAPRPAVAAQIQPAPQPAAGSAARDRSGAPAAPARIELAADNVYVVPSQPVAQIVVRRSRSLRGDVSFSWWTESGTAKPGRDFVPVKTRVEHIDNGQGFINLTIPVVVDPARQQSRSFYVVIDQPSDNATLGSRTLSMVTLPGSDPDASQVPGQ
ncbi:MAG: protein kinase [Steroidobacteraceae bacterium]